MKTWKYLILRWKHSWQESIHPSSKATVLSAYISRNNEFISHNYIIYFLGYILEKEKICLISLSWEMSFSSKISKS